VPLKYMSTSLTVAAQTSRNLARGDAQWFFLTCKTGFYASPRKEK
jgi:hypothetical protein